jgi:hypothetical protein
MSDQRSPVLQDKQKRHTDASKIAKTLRKNRESGQNQKGRQNELGLER